MEGTVICVTWTWWLVAASALIITLVGHYYQIAIMTGCGCPPSSQLVIAVTMTIMTNLHCSRYMILCQTLGYKYFVIVGFPVIRFPQRAK